MEWKDCNKKNIESFWTMEKMICNIYRINHMTGDVKLIWKE